MIPRPTSLRVAVEDGMRLRWSSLLLAAALILHSGAGASAMAESEDEKRIIDQILDLGGINDMLDAFPALIDQEMGTQFGELKGEDATMLRDTMRAAFDPGQFRSAIVAEFLEKYDASHASSTLTWQKSALGVKIRESDAKMNSTDAQQQLLEFTQGLELAPPAPGELEFVVRLDAATRSTELLTKMMFALMRGLMIGIAVLDPDSPPSTQEIDELVEKQTSQMAPMLQNQTLLTLLFTYQGLTDTERSAYLEFAESDAGHWYHDLVGTSFVNAMSRSGTASATHLAAYVEGRKGSVPSEQMKEMLESAPGEGRSFGHSTKQSGCISEAFKRRALCRDLACSVGTELFLGSCLETSQKEAAICIGAPSEEDLVATIYWRLAHCEERKAPAQACNRLMGTVQEYCAAPRTAL